MSSVIRSLVVRVGADLTKFNKNVEMAAKAMKDGFNDLNLNETKSALSGLNQSVKLTESEFRKATAGMDDWRDSTDGLRARINYLNDSMDDQKSILDGLKRQHQLVAAEQGDSTQEAIKLQIAINNQTAKIKENESELRKVTGQLDNYGNEADEAADKTSIFGDVFKGAFLSNMATQALSFVVNKLKELATQALETADELVRMSSVTGFSTDELQKMTFVGDDLGVSMETQASAMKKLINNMSEAKKESGAAYEAFKTLGINVTDSNGKLKDSKKIYYEVLDALKKVTNETERDAIAQDILGKSATELNPIIEAGGDVLEKLGEQAEKSGAVMSEDAVAALDSFGDGIDHLKQKVTAFVGEALANLIDAFNSVSADSLTQSAQAIEDVSQKYEKTTTDIQATAAVAEIYLDTLEKLETAGLNTAEAHKEYSDTVEKLNALMPDLNLKINEQTGLIEGGTTALKEHIAALKEEAMTQALRDKYIETVKAQADALTELATNQVKLKQAEADALTISANLDVQYQKLANTLGITFKEAKAMGQDVGQLITFSETSATDISDITTEIYNLSEQMFNTKKSAAVYSEAVADGQAAVDNATESIKVAAEVYEILTGKMIDATDQTFEMVNATDYAMYEVLRSMGKADSAFEKGKNLIQSFIDGMNAKQTDAEKKAYAIAHGAEIAIASAISGPPTSSITKGAKVVSSEVDSVRTIKPETSSTDTTQNLKVNGEVTVRGVNNQGETVGITKMLAEEMNRDARRRPFGVSFNPL